MAVSCTKESLTKTRLLTPLKHLRIAGLILQRALLQEEAESSIPDESLQLPSLWETTSRFPSRAIRLMANESVVAVVQSITGSARSQLQKRRMWQGTTNSILPQTGISHHPAEQRFLLHRQRAIISAGLIKVCDLQVRSLLNHPSRCSKHF